MSYTFGFEEYGQRIHGPDGNGNHAAMKFGEGIIMMGYPGPGYKSPKRLGQATQPLYIYVEDVDKHFDRARNAGATILEEPEDQFYGDRRYAAGQPES